MTLLHLFLGPAAGPGHAPTRDVREVGQGGRGPTNQLLLDPAITFLDSPLLTQAPWKEGVQGGDSRGGIRERVVREGSGIVSRHREDCA